MVKIARHVRRDDEFFLLPQGAVGRQRLGLAYVDGRAGDLAVLQRLQQHVVGHGVAPAAVYEQRAVLHGTETLGSIEKGRLRRAGQDGEHHVRLRQDAVDLLGQHQLVHALRAYAGAALYPDHPCAHGLYQPGIAQADIAQAHHQHGGFRQ